MRMGKRGRRKRKKQLCVGHFAVIPLADKAARLRHCCIPSPDRAPPPSFTVD
jgi:hypothetical protein